MDLSDTTFDDDLLADPRFAPSPPSAVVFDLGNVLIAWDPRRALVAGVGESDADAFLNHPEFEFAQWNHRLDLGEPLTDAIASVAAQYPELEAAARAYVEHFPASLAPIEGSVQILKQLHAAQVPLFAVTNWSAELFVHAKAEYDFLELFDDIVVSGEEKVAKPDPEMWEILQEATDNLCDLDEMVFVDDSLPNVESAVLAGLDAVEFTGPDDLRADLSVRGLLGAATEAG